MRHAALLPLACALVSACMTGPDYQRPVVDAPAAFQYETASAVSAGDVLWWKQFGDPVLDALVAEALANNKNLKVAVANLEQATAFLTQTRSALYPQIGYGASGERARTGDSGVPPDVARLVPDARTSYQAALSASWELDLWGRIRRLSEAARANALASDEARRGVVLSLVASVVTDYLQLRGLDAQLAIAKQTQGAYAESVKLFTLQFQYGQVSQMNVAQAQSQYETAAVQIPQIESQIAQTQNALAILLGRHPGPIERGKAIDALALPDVPAGVPSTLLERRPDLRQSEDALIAANAQIGAAKALYFPTISLTGAFGAASADLSRLFSGPARAWSYAGQLAGPIFTFGAVSGQVAQAEAARDAALWNYRQSIENAFGDVDNALIANQKLKEQLDAQARLVAALQDYSRLARLQYDGGYTAYSTVLQAEQSLFPAELQLAAVRTSMAVSSVNIYKAMGGGWVDAADTTSGSGVTLPAPDAFTKPPLF